MKSPKSGEEENPEKRRLFVGLRVPAGELPQVEQARKLLKKSADRKEIEVKWSPFSNYHVTLKFFGETEEELIPKIEEILEKRSREHAPLSLKISGIGAFPDERHARVVWLGVQASRALRALQSEIDSAFAEMGFAAETREYVPHLTIGRIRNPRNVSDMISPIGRKKLGKIEADRLILYESLMQGNFPVYLPLKEFLLTGERFTD